MPHSIYLASASPRRSELLRQIGVAHEVRAVELDEAARPDESATDYVVRLADAKARALWEQVAPAGRRPVLAADTTVALDGDIFGKPANLAEARIMLARLSGRAHQVHTAVTVIHHGVAGRRLSSSEVTFRTLAPAEIDDYWHTGEPLDKAGGYAVQGRGAVFIRRIEGSYSGIMGLPLFETWELLAPLLGQKNGSAA